jgi:hypothetical protein
MARYEPRDIEAIFDELEGQNDRAVAIVGSALLEHALQAALASQLRASTVKLSSTKYLASAVFYLAFMPKLYWHILLR